MGMCHFLLLAIDVIASGVLAIGEVYRMKHIQVVMIV